MDIKIDLNSLTKIDIKQAVKKISYLWAKTHMFIFFVFLFCLIILGGYVWQKNIYNAQWSDERKQQYMNSQDRKIIFNEKDFQEVTNEIQSRKNESQKQAISLKDIFLPY
jgi:hypothetical protein